MRIAAFLVAASLALCKLVAATTPQDLSPNENVFPAVSSSASNTVTTGAAAGITVTSPVVTGAATWSVFSYYTYLTQTPTPVAFSYTFTGDRYTAATGAYTTAQAVALGSSLNQVSSLSNIQCGVPSTATWAWKIGFTLTAGTTAITAPAPNVQANILFELNSMTNNTGFALSAVDQTFKLQPGKLLTFTTVQDATAGAGNTAPFTLTLAATAGTNNPFQYLSVIGNGKCPILTSTTGPQAAYYVDLTSNATFTASTVYSISNAMVDTYYIYLAPRVVAGTQYTNPLATTGFTLTATQQQKSGPGFCSQNITNGFCQSYPYSGGELISATSAANGTNTLGTSIPVTSAAPHAVFGVFAFTETTSPAVTYNYVINSTNAVVLSGSSNAAVAQVSSLNCSACSTAIASNSYTWTFAFQLNYAAATVKGATQYRVFQDTTILLVNNTALPLAAVDANKFQPGKIFYFVVAPNATAGAGNVSTATVFFTPESATAVNPFAYVSIIGGGNCPIPSNLTNVTAFKFYNLTSNATLLAGSYNFTVTTGTYWMYLAPVSTGSASSPYTNPLSATSTITYNVTATSANTCAAGANGFCSGAATLKSIASFGAAGLVAVFFMLF